MGEIIDLNDYRKRLEQQEIERLQAEVDERIKELGDLSPQPYYPGTLYSDMPVDFSAIYTPMPGSLDAFYPTCTPLGVLGYEDKNDGS